MAAFGNIGTITAHPGKGDELLEVMRAGSVDMDGCELYVIGRSTEDPDVLCVAELWRDAQAHAASLQVDAVRETIGRAMPLIAGIDGSRFEPAFGVGADVPQA
jgi:quinol monooxygenase YgiN